METPIPNTQLLYEDLRAEEILKALPLVLEKVERPVCSHDRPIPGLPIDPNRWPEWVERDGRYLASTPWGLADSVYAHEIGGEVYAITPILNVVIPGKPYPGAAMPERGYAVLDVITGMVTVHTENGNEPVHFFRLGPDVLEGADGRDLAKIIRRRLCRDRIPVYPAAVHITIAPYPYPLVRGTGHLTKTAYVANKEVGVPLVGYAIAPLTGEVVYLHIVGHKTAVRSIWATLNGRAGNVINITVPDDVHRAYSSQNYVTYSDPVDPDLGLVRLTLVDRRAVDREVADGEAFLIVPDGTAEHDLDRAFITRLNAVLPIPVLPEWGSTLRAEGEEKHLVKPCRFGGDVGLALAIAPDVERWQDLIEGLVRSGELTW